MAKKISFIIPFLNEEASLEPLTAGIYQALDAAGLKHFRSELILVDDGSSDKSYSVSKKIARKYATNKRVVKALSLKRNFGKTEALNAGLTVFTGDYLVMMDADLQDDPKHLPQFVELVDSTGADLAIGNRTNRYKGNGPKFIASKMANLLLLVLTGLKVHDVNCGFKMMTAEVANSLNLHSDYHRFIPVIASANGFTVREVTIKQARRKYGKSKYGQTGLLRFTKSLTDMTSIVFMHKFRDRPFQLFGRTGILLTLAGVGVTLYLTIGWFKGIPIHSRPLFFVGLLLIMLGINVVSLGLLGELISSSRETRQRFSVRELYQRR